MNRWRRIAEQVASELPRRDGKRLLVGGCFHGKGFRLFGELDRALRPDLAISVGDISGIGGAPERAVIASRFRPSMLLAHCQGNHDSTLTAKAMERKGALVLHPSEVIEVGGVRVWGMSDPNQTKLSPRHSTPYDMEKVRAVAKTVLPPLNTAPYIIIVHNSAMVRSVPQRVHLLICGHAHAFKVEKRGHWTLALCGTSGGGGIGHNGLRQFLVIDVETPSHRPLHVWTIETDEKTVSVAEPLVQV